MADSIHPDPRHNSRNVLGERLKSCCFDPITGFYRDGFCHTGARDTGSHTVCAQMTAEFLDFSQKVGNDLSTPLPEFHFPGLQPGDFWCICAARWKQAHDLGFAPLVKLEACHEGALRYATLDELQRYAF